LRNFLTLSSDFPGCRSLLIDCIGDGGSNLADLADRRANALDGGYTSVVVFCTAVICAEISAVALPVWLATLFTSPATTAKPLPASPARAASSCRRAD
jgi:hypothetical protein